MNTGSGAFYRRDPYYYASLDKIPATAARMGISPLLCPDWGTLKCLNCELGDNIPDCQFNCGKCNWYHNCSCTLTAWHERGKSHE